MQATPKSTGKVFGGGGARASSQGSDNRAPVFDEDDGFDDNGVDVSPNHRGSSNRSPIQQPVPYALDGRQPSNGYTPDADSQPYSGGPRNDQQHPPYTPPRGYEQPPYDDSLYSRANNHLPPPELPTMYRDGQWADSLVQHRPPGAPVAMDVVDGPRITSVRPESDFGTARHTKSRSKFHDVGRTSPPRSGVRASVSQQPVINTSIPAASVAVWREDGSNEYRVVPGASGSELERLQALLRSKDAELEHLRDENHFLQNELGRLSEQNQALIHRYAASHESLAQAARHIEQQNDEIMQLRRSLTSEVTDSDQLKSGFLDLVRKAQTELTRLRGELDYRERKERYEREFQRQQELTRSALSGEASASAVATWGSAPSVASSSKRY